MTDQMDSREAEIEQAHARLAEGLESCRAVIKNYQAIIGDAIHGANDPAADNEFGRPTGTDA